MHFSGIATSGIFLHLQYQGSPFTLKRDPFEDFLVKPGKSSSQMRGPMGGSCGEGWVLLTSKKMKNRYSNNSN